MIDKILDKICNRMFIHIDGYFTKGYSELYATINKIRASVEFQKGRDCDQLPHYINDMVSKNNKVKERNAFLEKENVDLMQKISFLKKEVESNNRLCEEKEGEINDR